MIESSSTVSAVIAKSVTVWMNCDLSLQAERPAFIMFPFIPE